jgi:hypothetical protein
MSNTPTRFMPRVPEPGTQAAQPAQTMLIEVKALRGGRWHRARRLRLRAMAQADRAVGGNVRGSAYNSWWMQLSAACLLVLIGAELIALGSGVFDMLLGN